MESGINRGRAKKKPRLRAGEIRIKRGSNDTLAKKSSAKKSALFFCRIRLYVFGDFHPKSFLTLLNSIEFRCKKGATNGKFLSF